MFWWWLPVVCDAEEIADGVDAYQLFYATGTVLAYVSGTDWHSLNNGGMTPDERAALDPASEEYQWRYVTNSAWYTVVAQKAY